MSLSFTTWRVAVFLMLIGLFAFAGGFSLPDPEFHHFRLREIFEDSWFQMAATFVFGATSACLVDHKVGLIDPTNLRPFYLVLGILAMVTAILWLFHLKGLWEIQMG